MLSITDRGSLARALALPLERRLAALLVLRQQQLGGDIFGNARFVVVEPGDTSADLEGAVGFSVFQNPGDGSRLGDADFTPGWEWIEDHGFAYELVFILTDDGYAHVVIVEKGSGVDARLLDLCATYASEHA